MMKEKAVLLLLTCGTNACFHVAKRLKEIFGDRITIVGTDINKGWMVSTLPWLDAFYQCPLTSNKHYYQFVLDICMTEGVDYILPSFDADQRLFYKGNPDLDRLHVKSLGISEVALNVYDSKENTNNFLIACGLSIPRCYTISEIEYNKEYFCKPKNGVGSVGARIMRGSEIIATNDSNLIIEEICTEPEVTLECFNYNGRVYSVARERLGTKAGICTKARVYYDQQLESIAQQFASFIELPYIFNLQFMTNTFGEKVITDVNLRTAGGMSISCAAGWDEVEALGKIILAEEDVISSVNVKIQEQYIIRAYTDIITKKIDKRIALDFDGTLLDSRKRHQLVMEHVLREMNITIDVSDLMSYKSEGHNNISWLIKNGLKQEEAEKINKRWVELIEDEVFLADDRLYTNTIEILRSLSRNNSLVLLTARNNKEGLNRQIDRLGIRQYFDQIIVVESCIRTTALKAEKLSQLQIDDFYGDTESDMNASMQAGCNFIASLRGFRSDKFWSEYDVHCSEAMRKI